MIVFTGDTYHARVSIIERSNGSYPSFLRIFSYIVEDDYITDDENISRITKIQLCKHNCNFFYEYEHGGASLHKSSNRIRYE